MPLAAFPPAALAGASLYVSPSSGTLSTGQNWNVTLFVNTDTPVNSIDATVTFPANILEADSVDESGTAFSIPLFQPQIDNGAGTVRFVQTSPSAYTGSSGKVGTIVFKAKATGSGSVGISSSSKVVAADGKGTNVFGGGVGASVNVSSAPASQSVVQQSGSSNTSQSSNTTNGSATTRTPVISSSTHPDQNAWYKSKTITYSWSGGAKGYNFTVDQNPSTQLPATVAGTTTTASTTVTSDGAWYAHVRADGEGGWSDTAHFKIQIDGTAPGSFSVTMNPSGEVSVLPTATFEAKDETSGIDHYEARVDNGDWQKVSSPYKVPSVSDGGHNLTVRAFDKAGNTTDAQADFVIKPLAAPVITSPGNHSTLMLGEFLKVAGKAEPGVKVEVYINNQKKEEVQADKNGNFVTKSNLLLFADTYQLVAKAINADGITSQPSEPVTLTVDARAVKIFGNVWPGWVVFGTIGLVIIVLLAAIGWMALKLWRVQRAWRAKLQGLGKKVEDDLSQLEHDVEAKVDNDLPGNTAAGGIKSELEAQVERVEGDVREVESGALEGRRQKAEGRGTSGLKKVWLTVVEMVGKLRRLRVSVSTAPEADGESGREEAEVDSKAEGIAPAPSNPPPPSTPAAPPPSASVAGMVPSATPSAPALPTVPISTPVGPNQSLTAPAPAPAFSFNAPSVPVPPPATPAVGATAADAASQAAPPSFSITNTAPVAAPTAPALSGPVSTPQAPTFPAMPATSVTPPPSTASVALPAPSAVPSNQPSSADVLTPDNPVTPPATGDIPASPNETPTPSNALAAVEAEEKEMES